MNREPKEGGDVITFATVLEKSRSSVLVNSIVGEKFVTIKGVAVI